MALLFWDASALAKRFFGEAGSETVNALFAGASSHEMAATPWAYAETYSILVRRLNAGLIDSSTFATAATSLQAEVVDSPDFGLLPLDDAFIFSSIALIQNHNLNATDAVILTMLLDDLQEIPLSRSACVLVATDKRLLRAADAEGLKTLDPELPSVHDVPAFLSSLS